MNWIYAAQTRYREDALLGAYWLARDNGHAHAVRQAHEGVVDFYAGAGCPSPDFALLGALLINPAGLAEVRAVVTPEMFTRPPDAALYRAMLCTPVTAGLAEWWRMLARVSGLTVGDVTAYLCGDYHNATQLHAYAATMQRTYRYTTAIRIAQRLIDDLYNAGDGIDTAVQALAQLQGDAAPPHPTTARQEKSAARRWATHWSAQ